MTIINISLSLVLALVACLSIEAQAASTPFTCPKDYKSDKNPNYRDPENCRKFYVCKNDTVEHFECAANESLNPVTRYCAPTDEVTCIKGDIIPPKPKFTCPKNFKSDKNPNYRDPENCRKFYVCNDNDTVDHWGCAAGQSFNPETRFCAPTDEVTCIKGDIIPPKPKFTCPKNFKSDKNPNYRDPEDCQKFYVCNDNDTVDHWGCAAGQSFNPETRFCAPTNEVTCIKGGVTPPQPTKFTCPAGYKKECNRFYRDPKDCKKFYVCNDHSVEHLSCDGTDLFNSKTRYCDDADKVTCTA